MERDNTVKEYGGLENGSEHMESGPDEKRVKLYHFCKAVNMLSLVFLVLDLFYICYQQTEALNFMISSIKEGANSFYFAQSVLNFPAYIGVGLVLIFIVTGVMLFLLRKNLTVTYLHR